MLIFSSLYFVPVVERRVDILIDDVSSYFVDSDVEKNIGGSFGIRAELWKSGVCIFKENPVFGVGVGRFRQSAAESFQRCGVAESVGTFRYAHNQYVAALATRGVFGLVLFVLFLFSPVYFVLCCNARTFQERVAKMSVILICSVYMIGCLGEDHFEMKSAVVFYPVMISFFLSRLSTFEVVRS
jgi:O-antigen ligase